MMAAMLSVVLLWGSLLWRFSSSLQHATGRAEMLEDKVFHEIFQGYIKAVRPATLDSRTVEVKHGFSITRMVDLKDDVMTLDIWHEMEWTDARLRWNPADHDDVDRVLVLMDSIWVPDVVLYNSAGTSTDLYQSVPRQAQAVHDGTVFVYSAMRLLVWCGDQDGCSPVDQNGIYTCQLKFGSWGYDGFKVDLHKRQDNIDLSSLLPHSQWSVTNTSATRNVVLYPCCPEPFPDITYSIQLAPKYGSC